MGKGEIRWRTAVRVKGVPPKATATDVVSFLENVRIDASCVRLLIKERRSAGEALVVFQTEKEAAAACQKDRDFFSPKKFGERYVRVVPADDLSQEEISHVNVILGGGRNCNQTTPPLSMTSTEECAVRVDGLPASIVKQEVLQLFWGAEAIPDSIVIRKLPNCKHASAYLRFSCADHATRATTKWHGTLMTVHSGSYSLSVQRTSKAEFEANSQEDAHAVQNETSGLGGLLSAIVKLRGLPVRATTADVTAFLNGYKFKPGNVYVQPYSENRHSKIAYIEFETEEDAGKAIAEKDHKQFGEAFGERYCLLQRASQQELHADLTRFAALSASRSRGTHTSATTSIDGSASTRAPSSYYSHPISREGGTPDTPPCGGPSMTTPTEPVPWIPSGGPIMTHGNFPLNFPQYPGFMSSVPGTLPYPPAAATAGLYWGSFPPQSEAQTAAARYMVQDLKTGQKVYLDPRFNVYPGHPQPGLGQPPPMVPVWPQPYTAATQDGLVQTNYSQAMSMGFMSADEPGGGRVGNANSMGMMAGLENASAHHHGLLVGPDAENDGDKNGGSGEGSNQDTDEAAEGTGSGSGSDPAGMSCAGKKEIINTSEHIEHAVGKNGIGIMSGNGGVTSLLRETKELHSKRPSFEASLAGDGRPAKVAHTETVVGS